MKRNVTLAILFVLGLAIGLVRFYPARAPHESTPPGLRELMLGSIANGTLDLTRLRLAAAWDRVCLLPSGTSDQEALQKLPFLGPQWRLSEHSGVAHASVTAVLLFGEQAEPVGVADLPRERVHFDVAGGACLARNAARFPAN
jgi:hypothetical protein